MKRAQSITLISFAFANCRTIGSALCGPVMSQKRGCALTAGASEIGATNSAALSSRGRMQPDRLKRRDFITLLGGAAVAWPLAARAQQPEGLRRVGVLVPLPASVFVPFFNELGQFGFVEGQNLAVDRRGFDARYDRFAAIAAELVKAAPEAVVCGGDAAIRAAQAATSIIPIVAITDDMVVAGLVGSLARPGGNTSGVSILAADLDGKRQE